MTKHKSRYCVKCNAIYKFQCSCPNNVRYRNIMEHFRQISMVSAEKAALEVGLR